MELNVSRNNRAEERSLHSKTRKPGKTNQMWHGIQMITGYKEKEKRICVKNENQVANEINIFFARFENTDFVQERALELEILNIENGHPMTLQAEEV